MTFGELLWNEIRPQWQADWERIWDPQAWRKRLAERLAEDARREACDAEATRA